jgi:hypothetical protein
MFRVTKKLVIVGAVVAVVLTASVAYALWPATGSGSGRARAVTAQAITVTAATGAADLYPGFAGGDVFFTMTNANPYAATFTAMTPGAVTSSDPTNCPASNVSVVSATGLNLNVAGNTTSPTVSIADVVTMASAAPDGCQGVSFTITLSLTGSQV